MDPSDEARAARIQKYKEERRKQLTAKTATLFSANVTQRRTKKVNSRALSEDITSPLKSSSELSLNTASTSVPIRTTRTSRLRAAASSQLDQSDTSLYPRKTNRSSSVTSLIDDVRTKPTRSSRIIERDKNKVLNRRESREEKENLQSASTTCVLHKDNGAIKTKPKPKHSISKNNLEKDKSKNIVIRHKDKKKDAANISVDKKARPSCEGVNKKLRSKEKSPVIANKETNLSLESEEIFEKLANNISSNPDQFDDLFKHLINEDKDAANISVDKKETPSSEIVIKKLRSKEKSPINVNKEKPFRLNSEEIFEELANNIPSNSDQFDDLFKHLINEDIKVVQNEIKLNPNDEILNPTVDINSSVNSGLKYQYPVPKIKELNKEIEDIVKIEDISVSEVNNVHDGAAGLLGVTCVRKVELFSELFSNLCSPHEPDLLFEDILAENGLEKSDDVREADPARTQPCRRAQPTRTTSTPKRAPAPSSSSSDGGGTTTKSKNRSPYETRPKTETSLSSSKVSPKSTFNLSLGIKSSIIPTKSQERRRSSDTTTKPSCIPLSRKSIEKSRNSASLAKRDLAREGATKIPESKNKIETTKLYRISDKSKSDSETTRDDRRHRAQKNCESVNERYHNSKKRLTSLENNTSKQAHNAKNVSPKSPLNDDVQVESKEKSNKLVDCCNIENMSTLHETVRPHASRLSQEMDSLQALTKQTLDRVNKLSNNFASSKFNIDSSDPNFDALFAKSTEQKDNYSRSYNNGLKIDRSFPNRGVTERLKDIDTAAQRLIDFEKQSAMFSDLNNDTSSQNRRIDNSTSCSHTPVSILKRKSIHEDSAISNTPNNAIASPPVTFSPNVIERNSRSDRQRQGILKKRRSLDESQVARRRSCSPEVSFAEDGSPDTGKPILKNRRSSLEDVVRTHSPDGQIQGILKRKMSREEEPNDDLSHESPEPHGILKRKSNSSSSSSTVSSHVSIAQAVLLAAAGGAEIIDDDKETVRPILKKKSFSEERPSPDLYMSDTPRPILKKKSLEHDEHEFDLPKRPILKISKKSGVEGHASSFDLSEDDRSSRRSSLLRSRTSDHSGSECETTVKPILKQRGSSLTRERSQSPRPRLSFCADNDANISVANFSNDANDLSAAGPSRVLNIASDPKESATNIYPSAVLRRRNQRPKTDVRSKSLVCDVNDELLLILNTRRIKLDKNCVISERKFKNKEVVGSEVSKPFPSIATRIKTMEQALVKESLLSGDEISMSKRNRGDRYKTQPITVDEMRSITSSTLEPGQPSFQAFGPIGSSFPSRPVESSASALNGEPSTVACTKDPFDDFGTLDSSPFDVSPFVAKYSPPFNGLPEGATKDDSFGEATFLDFNGGAGVVFERRQSTLEEIEKEVDQVREALDEHSRALEEDERNQAEADNWSLNVSCDSGVYNRASSRDSGPHSGEELGLIESQEIKDNHATNSSADWSPTAVERDLLTMDRERKSTEVDGSDDETQGFALGLVKSNSVVARASMWQQLQQKAKGTPKPVLRHNRSKTREGAVAERFKTQPINFNTQPVPFIAQPGNFKAQHVPIAQPVNPAQASPPEDRPFGLSQSKSTANVLDRDEDAKLDEDDPAKMSLMDKMKMFNSKLTHKPPPAGLPKANDRVARASRLKTMPVLASQVQEALENNERLTKSYTQEVPRNPDFALKMELFRSASAKNTSLEYLMRENAKFRSLDLDNDDMPSDRAERMITPEVRGILKAGTTAVPKSKIIGKGESSEGLKDEGIDSSSDDESASASSVSSSEKSCSSSDSSEEIPEQKPKTFLPEPQEVKPRRFAARKNNKLKNSRTESDIAKVTNKPQDLFPMKIQMPCANELKERLGQAKNPDVKIPMLAKLGRKPSEEAKPRQEDTSKRPIKKLEEPIQLGKLRRPPDTVPLPLADVKPPQILKISALNQEAKNKFFGIEPKKEKSMDELAAAVRRFIPPVSKSMSTAVIELGGSGSDGESSGGREVRQINTRVRQRPGRGIQRSATHAEMPNRGSTIAERLAALQAAGANDWRARVCRLSPDKEDSKAIESAKNRINETLNSVDEKKAHNEDNELWSNILADRRNKLETAAQGWRKRVPQTDASLFTVAGRLERDKVSTPPLTPPPVPTLPAAPASPGVPTPNKFRSRKIPSPTNGFTPGPLRSASCAVVSAALTEKPKVEPTAPVPIFKRSQSVNESISRLDEKDDNSPGLEKQGTTVRVPRADDETFHAFYTPVLEKQDKLPADLDVDLDAIDSGHRQLLASDWAKRAKRERRQVGSRNPLKALAARTDILEEYSPTTSNIREQFIKEKVTANCGLAAEALAALATKEDFSNVALRSATTNVAPSHGTKPLMLLHVKGRRRVQTRLVEPVHTSINSGDCFVLVTTDQIFLYHGHYANVIERNRSADIATHIQNTKDLGCKNALSVITLDEQTKNYTNKHWNQFWALLGIKDGTEQYKPAETGHADEDEIFENCIIQTNICYEVMDDELVPINEYWGQMPKIAMLHQSKVIVFDFGSEMYIWYGKNVPLESRRRAAQLAQELFDDGYNYDDCHINPVNAAAFQGAREQNTTTAKNSKTRPDWAILSKITQHMETILFKEKFLDWPDYTRVIKVKPQENKANSIEITPCDAEEMWANDYQDPDLILEGSHVGRGTHYHDKEEMRHFDIKTKSVCKWVIQEYDFQKVEDESNIADFYSADSYIIRWEYIITATGRELNGKPSKHNVTGRDRCAYFCWQGKDASPSEKGAAALLTVELDKERGPQIRVCQGTEPAAFLNLFQGNLVIHQGKKDADKSRYKLFVTRGNLSNEAYLLQVPCSVRQLRSRGSLLLVDTEKGCLYIWHGARSLKHTKNIAIELANKLIARESSYLFGSKVSSIKITEVKEGEEPKEVTEALGGANRQYYNSVLNGGKDSSDTTPRLFHFTDLGGQFEANEVLSPLRHEHLVTPFPFEQKELYASSQPALFLLDDGQALWLWQGWWPRGEDGELEPAERNTGVGAFAARWQAMRAAALRTAEAYWKVSRGTRPDVRVVTAGLEPQSFTDLFDTWRENDEAAEANIEHGYKAGEILSGACELSRLTSCDAIVPIAALQRRPLPDHVDPQHLERHLSSPDFLEAFGMTKEDFTVLPAWKQTNMKKEIGLF